MFFKKTEGKHSEFKRFFLHYHPKVIRIAQIILKSEDEAKDAAQDIFLKLWDKPEIWMGQIDTCSAYIYSITKNYIFDQIKHKKVEQDYIDNISSDLFSDLNITNPYNNIYAKELSLLIQLTINQMPEKRKNVFEMSRFEGKTNNEIALELDLSVRTVERHIYLALLELKTMIQDLYDRN